MILSTHMQTYNVNISGHIIPLIFNPLWLMWSFFFFFLKTQHFSFICDFLRGQSERVVEGPQQWTGLAVGVTGLQGSVSGSLQHCSSSAGYSKFVKQAVFCAEFTHWQKKIYYTRRTGFRYLFDADRRQTPAWPLPRTSPPQSIYSLTKTHTVCGF